MRNKIEGLFDKLFPLLNDDDGEDFDDYDQEDLGSPAGLYVAIILMMAIPVATVALDILFS